MLTEIIYIPKLKLNITFYVGKNAQENFDIIDMANENDLWFHLNDYASCHVVGVINHLRLNKKELSYIIKQGAILCKNNSKYKSEKKISIIYTNISNVIKTKIIGNVSLSKTKLIDI